MLIRRYMRHCSTAFLAWRIWPLTFESPPAISKIKRLLILSSLRSYRSPDLHSALFHCPLFHAFLAGDAVTRPRHSLQAFGVDFIPAGDTFPEVALTDALQSPIDHVQELPVIVALREQELLGIGICGAIGDILSSLSIGYAAIFFRPGYRTAQLLLPGFQLFPKLFELLLFHKPSAFAGYTQSDLEIDAAFGPIRNNIRARRDASNDTSAFQ